MNNNKEMVTKEDHDRIVGSLREQLDSQSRYIDLIIRTLPLVFLAAERSGQLKIRDALSPMLEASMHRHGFLSKETIDYFSRLVENSQPAADCLLGDFPANLGKLQKMDAQIQRKARETADKMLRDS